MKQPTFEEELGMMSVRALKYLASRERSGMRILKALTSKPVPEKPPLTCGDDRLRP